MDRLEETTTATKLAADRNRETDWMVYVSYMIHSIVMYNIEASIEEMAMIGESLFLLRPSVVKRLCLSDRYYVLYTVASAGAFKCAEEMLKACRFDRRCLLDSFWFACRYHQPGVAKWFVDVVGVQSTVPGKARNCEQEEEGYAPVLLLHLPHEGVGKPQKACHWETLAAVCHTGDLQFAEWFVNTFGIREDMRVKEEDNFDYAMKCCETKNADLIVWFCREVAAHMAGGREVAECLWVRMLDYEKCDAMDAIASAVPELASLVPARTFVDACGSSLRDATSAMLRFGLRRSLKEYVIQRLMQSQREALRDEKALDYVSNMPGVEPKDVVRGIAVARSGTDELLRWFAKRYASRLTVRDWDEMRTECRDALVNPTSIWVWLCGAFGMSR